MEAVPPVDRGDVMTIRKPSERASGRRDVGPREHRGVRWREGLADDRRVCEKSAIVRVELVEPSAKRALERER